MASRTLHRRVRKWHRYLGVVFGIQFLFWTIGGFYFSWTNIKTIRGDDVAKPMADFPSVDQLIAPTGVLDSFRKQIPGAAILGLELTPSISGAPFYSLRYTKEGHEHFWMANALTGEHRSPVDSSTAGRIALDHLRFAGTINRIYRITETGPHHEYREKPIPAFAVEVKGPRTYTVYVGQETGQVHSIRHQQWRIFDFLWMMHILDFKSRDNINNILLRTFSLLGMITLLSGYALFWVSRRKKKQE